MSARLLGQQISWTVVLPQMWSHEAKKMVDRPAWVRTGTVWSAGPVTGTVWVIPDDPLLGEGHAVCVELRPHGKHRARKIDQQRSMTKLHADVLGRMRIGWSIPATMVPSTPYPRSLDRGA